LKLLITGGAGFIGSNYIRRIIDGSLKGVDSIILLDKLTYAGTLLNLSSLPSDSFEFIEGDICDQELVDRLSKRSDAIVNFAAESHVDRSILGARVFFQTNVLGVHNLLDSARRNQVETFIQISTDEVYGSINEGSWPESDPLLPNSPYAASKASADLICRAFFNTYGCDVRVTRSSNNYGPYQFPEKVIPLFITNLIDNLKIPVYGTGTNIRDWLHVDDHCIGIHTVLTKGSAGEIYNIGGGTELSNLELTHKILSLMNKDESIIEFVEDRLGHDSRYSVDISKISEKLQYQPSIDFENGLMETVNWYIENEKWWRGLKQK
jgi:dTDP-glucose 4,6-dehydratase